MQKIILRKMKDLLLGKSILYCRYHCFHDSRNPYILIAILAQIERDLERERGRERERERAIIKIFVLGH